MHGLHAENFFPYLILPTVCSRNFQNFMSSAMFYAQLPRYAGDVLIVFMSVLFICASGTPAIYIMLKSTKPTFLSDNKQAHLVFIYSYV